MATTQADGIALSVHGPAGVLDLVVPGGASVWDLAREYGERAGVTAIPLIYTRSGRALTPDAALSDCGLGPGDVVVAAMTAYRPGPGPVAPPVAREAARPPGPLSAVGLGVAAAAGLLSGVLAGGADLGAPVVLVLLAATALGVLPVGRYAAHRAVAAPAFAAAAAFAIVWRPGPEFLLVVCGAAGLAAAVAAAVARALARPGSGADEALAVWIVTGALLAAGGAATAVLDVPAPAVWSVLLVLAMLAARFVPALAIDVPDHYLLDVQRLAVSAWSARDQPRAQRPRTVVPERAVQEVADRGARTVTATAVAIAAVALLASGALLVSDVPWMDRIGIRVLVGLVALSLLLVARSHRHVAARAFLRAGGIVPLLMLGPILAADLPGRHLVALTGALVGLAVLLLVAAVATGRGWRSVRWSRRAEIAESLLGAAAIASLFVATGLFRMLFELTARNAPS